MDKTDLLKELAITAELFGKPVSEDSAKAYLRHMDGYPPAACIKALHLCQRELRTFPTVADIISRIDDGRPSPEIAWGMMPKSEADSVVWTEEMKEAFLDVNSLLDDPIAARMAFKESYQKLLQIARIERRPTVWTASLGHDKIARERVLKQAVTQGRLNALEAQKLLPDCSFAQSRQTPKLDAPAHIAGLLPEGKP